MAYISMPADINEEHFKDVYFEKGLKFYFHNEDVNLLMKNTRAEGITLLNYNASRSEIPDWYPAMIAVEGLSDLNYESKILTGEEPLIIALSCPRANIPMHVELEYDENERKFKEKKLPLV